MAEQQPDLICIRSTAKRNAITSASLGAVGLLLSWLLLLYLPQQLFLLGIFVTSLSIVALLIGWLKLREPQYSVELSRQGISYRHRCGQWRLDWDNVQRIDIPRVQNGLDQQSLDMVGIRLKHYLPLLEHISPRLATNILMEQRPLLMHANASSCATGTCYSEHLIEDDAYKAENGKVVRGVLAMLANRMTKLREGLGYDLYLSPAELDRSCDEFVSLLRQCHQQVDHQALRQSA